MSKMIFPSVQLSNTQIHKYKYTNTNTQIRIHKHSFVEVPEIPNICYISKQLLIQGCQKWSDPTSKSHMVSFRIRTHVGEAADEPAWRERTDPRGDCSNLINRGVRLSQWQTTLGNTFIQREKKKEESRTTLNQLKNDTLSSKHYVAHSVKRKWILLTVPRSWKAYAASTPALFRGWRESG